MMVGLFIGLGWISLGTVAALALGRASAIGASEGCRLTRLRQR